MVQESVMALASMDLCVIVKGPTQKKQDLKGFGHLETYEAIRGKGGM